MLRPEQPAPRPRPSSLSLGEEMPHSRGISIGITGDHFADGYRDPSRRRRRGAIGRTAHSAFADDQLPCHRSPCGRYFESILPDSHHVEASMIK